MGNATKGCLTKKKIPSLWSRVQRQFERCGRAKAARHDLPHAMTYRTHDVPVDGGALRVGEWGPDDPGAPTVVAVHGITASHLAWAALAQAMPQVRLIAPD